MAHRPTALFLFFLLCAAYHAKGQKAQPWYLDSMQVHLWQTESAQLPQHLNADQVPLVKPLATRGLATPLPAAATIRLADMGLRFISWVSLKPGSHERAEFSIWADGERVWASDSLRPSQAPVLIDLDIRGADQLTLMVDGGWRTESQPIAYWTDARLLMVPTATFPRDAPRLLPFLREVTPVVEPATSAALVCLLPKRLTYFPGSLIHQRVQVVGAKHINVLGLPPGLAYDKVNQVIKGTVGQMGFYYLTIVAENGKSRIAHPCTLTITYRPFQALPARGWLPAQSFAKSFSQLDLEYGSRALAATGLLDVGWEWMVVGEGWQGDRNARLHALQPNGKFPLLQGWLERARNQGIQTALWMTTSRRSPSGYMGTHADTWTGKLDPDFNKMPRGRMDFAAEDMKQWADWKVDGLWLQGADLDSNDAVRYRRLMDGLRQVRWIGMDHLASRPPSLRQPAEFIDQNIMTNSQRYEQSWFLFRQQVLALRQGGRLATGVLAPAEQPDPYYQWTDQMRRLQLALLTVCQQPMWLQDNLDSLRRRHPSYLAWYKNPELISLHHASGSKARCIAWDEKHDCGIWHRTLANGSQVVLFVNMGTTARSMTYTTHQAVAIRDILARKTISKKASPGSQSCSVGPFGAELWLLY